MNSIDDTLMREQLRQAERKKIKQQKSKQRQKDNYFRNLNKKKQQFKPDNQIDLETYKKIDNDKAKQKAEQRAWEWFSRYIRLRDLEKDPAGNIFGFCIACNKLWEVQQYSDGSIINVDRWNASHYFRQDLYESIKFDEMNVNLSCYNCNRNLGGNLNLYKINLIKKIGPEEFEKLEIRRNNPKHYNIVELIKLKEKYMMLCKQEIERLGIKL